MTLTPNGANVDFKVSLRASPNLDFVSTGNRNSHAIFAFNATGVALADIINISSGSPAHTLVAFSGAKESPYGSFSFGIDCPTCANGAPGKTLDDLKFTVKNAVVGDFAHKSTGGTAAYFAADIIQTTTGTTGAIGATVAGVSGSNSVSSVPEPDTYAMMFAGLAGLGFVARRRSAGTGGA